MSCNWQSVHAKSHPVIKLCWYFNIPVMHTELAENGSLFTVSNTELGIKTWSKKEMIAWRFFIPLLTLGMSSTCSSMEIVDLLKNKKKNIILAPSSGEAYYTFSHLNS